MAYPLMKTFDLNSSVSAAQTTEGKFDEDAHAGLIKPLRERILAHDGIDKCYVGAYEIEVTYMPGIISGDAVQQIVEEAIEWATTNIEGIFPLRGDKTPAIVKHKPTPPAKTNKASVFAQCNHAVIRYFPSGEEPNKYDRAQAALEEKPLAAALAGGIPGVTNHKIGYNGVRLDFDTDFVSTETVQEHIERVLMAAKRPTPIRVFWMILSTVTFGRVSRRDYFPYLKDMRDLEIEFEVRENE